MDTVKNFGRAAAALLAGFLFGAGLAVSGMVNPAKILSFLDVGSIGGGGWDATLLFVMAGALAVAQVPNPGSPATGECARIARPSRP